MAQVTSRPTDLIKKKIVEMNNKIDELQKFAETLSEAAYIEHEFTEERVKKPRSRLPEEPRERPQEGPLRDGPQDEPSPPVDAPREPADEKEEWTTVTKDNWETLPANDVKKFILLKIIENLRDAVPSLQDLKENNYYQKDWVMIQQKVVKLMDGIPTYDIDKLAEHRNSFVRWVKEFFALIFTGIIPGLIVTACNAYKAEKGTFSFSDVGFFPKPKSVSLLDNMLNFVDPEENRALIDAQEEDKGYEP